MLIASISSCSDMLHLRSTTDYHTTFYSKLLRPCDTIRGSLGRLKLPPSLETDTPRPSHHAEAFSADCTAS